MSAPGTAVSDGYRVGRDLDTSPEDVVGALDPRTAIAAVIAVLGLCLVVAVASGGAAGAIDGPIAESTNETDGNETGSEESTTPPEIGPATKINATAIELVLLDDVGIDPSTVEKAHFDIRPRHVANVTVREHGTNASVIVLMPRPTDSDVVTLEVRDNSSIADVDGNALNRSEPVVREVHDMDGVPPEVRRFSVTNRDYDSIVIEFFASEDVGDVNAVLHGTETVSVGGSAFDSPAGSTRYSAEVTPPGDGTWTVSLTNVSDASGNVLAPRLRAKTEVYNDPPDAVAGIDFAASEGRTFTFDAGRSYDPQGIETYRWQFAPGETATGERVTHSFAPGNYSVTLTAVDSYGNEGTDRLVLNLTRGGNASGAGVGAADVSELDDPFVTVGRGTAGDSEAAMIDVAGARGDEPVRIGAGVEPVAVGETFRVEQLDVNYARDGSYSLAVSTDAGDSVSDLDASRSLHVLGSMTVVHTFSAEAVEGATFTVSLRRSFLDETGFAPEDLAVHRYSNGSWNRLETTVVHRGTDRYHLAADSPGFSRFAIAADEEPTTPEPTPTDGNGTERRESDANGTDDLPVTGIELNRSQLAPGETVLVTATVENRGEELETFDVALSVDDTVVGTETLTIPVGQNRTAGFAHTLAEPGAYSTNVNGTQGPEIAVGEGGGGGPFGIFGILGFLPLGLAKSLLTYVGGALGAGYMLLKAAAIFMGY